jgi:Tfp pilus assembly protein PilV
MREIVNHKVLFTQSGSSTIEFLCAALLLSISITVLLRFHQQIVLRLAQQSYAIEAERLIFQQLDNYPINIAYDKQHWSCQTYTLNHQGNCSLVEISCKFQYGQPHNQQRWFCSNQND